MKTWMFFNNGNEGGKLGTEHLPTETIEQSLEFCIGMSGPIDGDNRRGGLMVGCLINDGQDGIEILQDEDREYMVVVLEMATKMVKDNDMVIWSSNEHPSSFPL